MSIPAESRSDRAGATAPAPGRPLWAVPDPGPSAPAVTDGAPLLDQVRAALTRYVVFPSPEAEVACTLWVAATHGLPAWQHATRLVVRSPEKRCGKSRLFDLLARLCHRPRMTVNATSAAIFRSIGTDDPPTLLIDEADSLFGTRKAAEATEALRGLLNAGFQRGRPVLRVGSEQTPTEYPTFAMAALAGIGSMPDTIEDRAVIIAMRRKAPGEEIQPYRDRRDGPLLDAVCEDLAAWMAAHLDALTDAVPHLPVEDRAADTWEPLIAIADLAGGDWPTQARQACLALTAAHDRDAIEASLGARLLSDCRDVLASDESVPSAELVHRLRALPEAPWTLHDLDQRSLARHLADYGITPDRIRFRDGDGVKQARGYQGSDFADAWNRYLPAAPGVTASQRDEVDPVDRSA